MQGKRLFERIVRLDVAARQGLSPSPQPAGGVLRELTDSIGRYLKKLLNTRQGSVPQAPDFGTPDLTELAQSFGGSALLDMEDRLAAVIARYEPRLSEVKVKHVPDKDQPFTANFTISGSIRHSGSLVPVVYETQIAPDGHIEVQGYA